MGNKMCCEANTLELGNVNIIGPSSHYIKI